MLRDSILEFGGSWDTYLPLAEFAYNYSFQSSIQMAPYEALYGRGCRSFEDGETNLLGPELVQEAKDKVQLIRQRLLTSQSRQKSYADKRRRDLVFTIGDKVFLRVSPMKVVMRFGKRGKLSPRFIGPYEILDRVGAVAYRSAFPPKSSFIHPHFHASMLRKCILDSSQVLEAHVILRDEKLTYEEEPVAIVNRQVRKLWSKQIVFFKVLWRNHTVEESMWEVEKDIQAKYPHLFQSTVHIFEGFHKVKMSNSVNTHENNGLEDHGENGVVVPSVDVPLRNAEDATEPISVDVVSRNAQYVDISSHNNMSTTTGDCSTAKPPKNSKHSSAGNGSSSQTGTGKIEQQWISDRSRYYKDARGPHKED
ncbi:uncharacterized protein [Nicotiana sylvestris]|uniref:uncharacterized protein n=1 Tax=Nicotiana sylvestris TaxID=4096 RepID=UPI00388C6304